MNRKANVVIFSSGITEQNGILQVVRDGLEMRGHQCMGWRELFSNANDIHNIALLPMLIKKIPTFDYALLICEGHDKTSMRRGKMSRDYLTMRDNVLFEIGLCCMGIGLSRVMLLTDHDVRLPEDLLGADGDAAIPRFMYDARISESYKKASGDIAAYMEWLDSTSKELSDYIYKTQDVLDPVVVGSASAIACSYATNFILRLLEHITEGIYLEAHNPASKTVFHLSQIYVTILIPEIFSPAEIEESRHLFEQLRAGAVDARSRRVEFRYAMQKDGSIHIYDYPTNIVTAYTVSKIILGLYADDAEDADAQERFVAKELDLFCVSLKRLLGKDHQFIAYTIQNFYSRETEEIRNTIIERISDVVDHRLEIRTAYGNRPDV